MKQDKLSESVQPEKVNNSKSKLDALTGNHTTSIIVAILFVITLLSLIILVCVKDKLPDGLLTGLVGLLGMFGGFFAGSYKKAL